ncbi:MAG: class F sortase [Patescibacteria group bacterium]
MSKRKLLQILIIGVILPLLGYFLYANRLSIINLLPSNRISEGASPTENIDKNLESATSQPESPFDSFRMGLYSEPKKLYLNTFDLSLNIVHINVEEDGALGVPANWGDAGWYEDGAMPGQNGNLIIAAHYDTNTGSPAAFWQLKNIKVDDTVSVVDEYGREYTYKITDSFYVDIQDPNRLEIFETTEAPTVTLITCGGVWLPGQGYNKRLVVKGLLTN